MSNIHTIILGSKSPRRRELLSDIGYRVIVADIDADESFPETMEAKSVAPYLSEVKSECYTSPLTEGEVLITADTVVILEDRVLGKPADSLEAKSMLRSLSGHTHSVITGVTLRTPQSTNTFAVETEVVFREISDSEIDYYVENYSPLDKAGAYGAQEWIGTIAITEFRGSYHNVVGLPVSQIMEILKTL